MVLLQENVECLMGRTQDKYQVLGRMGKEKRIMNTLEKTTISYFGHLMRNE